MAPKKLRSRGSKTYTKPPLSHEDLLTLLRQRNLEIPDEERALRYIRHLGYYRLSPYYRPFQTGVGDNFKEGTSFDNILELYVFDRSLRLLTLDALERIEVAIRAALSDHMATKYKSAFWYEKTHLFKNQSQHQQFLALLDRICRKQLESPPEKSRANLNHPSALEYYLTTYGTPSRPPSWLVVEELTIGQLYTLVDNLKENADLKAIAESLGIKTPLLKSWLRSYVRIRNICAHHGRLWNRVLGTPPNLPTSKSVPWLDDREGLSKSSHNRERLYPVLISIQSLLVTVSPKSTWAWRLKELLSRYPDVPLKPMGIPEGWHEDSFWRKHIHAPK